LVELRIHLLGRIGKITLETHTTMQQKLIYKHYLLIGISAIIIFFNGCVQEIEYGLTMDLLYVNQTDETISFSIINSNNQRETVSISPNSESEIFTYFISGFNKIPEIETCCQEPLIDVYGGRGTEGNSQVLIINDELCVTHLNEKSVVLSNYLKEKISDRHFRYSYTFINNDIENKHQCE
jgi:hypothetical protein